MENRYRIIASSNTFCREFEFFADRKEAKIGTDIGQNFRLRIDFFFEQVELSFLRVSKAWTLFCPDNLHISPGKAEGC